MDRLVTVKDVQKRYGCSMATARRYLRQVVPHMENPLTAQAWAFMEWEAGRTVIPPETAKAERERIAQRSKGVYVPRKRERGLNQ